MSERIMLLILLLGLIPMGMRTLAFDSICISARAANEILNDGSSLTIIDVRNQSEYDSGHVKSAKLIPIWELASRLNDLRKTDEILICSTEGTSTSASRTLTDNGFIHVNNLLGGMKAWIAAGYPVYIKYPSIQEAIDNAKDGDIINVSSGLYFEHLTINRSITLDGENKETTYIDGSENGTVISIEADCVTLTGLTVQRSGCSCTDFAGVYVRADHQDIILTNNNIAHNGYGVKLVQTQNVTVDRNRIEWSYMAVEVLSSSVVSISDNSIAYNSFGINLNSSSNNRIIENNITSNTVEGVFFGPSSNEDTLARNRITGSLYGADLQGAFNNTFKENAFIDNGVGLYLTGSADNALYSNCFNNNSQHARIFYDPHISNRWDSGNVTGGNYWSDYTGLDLNHDAIGDSPYILDENNQDRWPLMGKFTTFFTSGARGFDAISNSTIEDFEYFSSSSLIKLHASNTTENQKEGFCRLTIPHDLMPSPYNITVDSNPTGYTTIYENATLSIIYFTYQHSTLEIEVIPELQSLISLALFIIATLSAVAVCKKERQTPNVTDRPRENETSWICPQSGGTRGSSVCILENSRRQ